MSILKLRDYQAEALDKAFAAWNTYQRIAIVHPTGAGKTVVMAHMIDRHLRGVTTGRVAVLVHRDELVQQTLAKVHSVAPDLSTGVVKAGRNEIDADVVVISVQTIARERRLHAIPADHFSLVIVDECFPAGTLVGDQPIEDLKPGDAVPSWDENTGKPVTGRVVRVMKRRPTAMVRVRFEDGSQVECTPEHPFMTSAGWSPASQLHGAHVLSFPHDDATTHPVHRVPDSDHVNVESANRRLAPKWARILLDRLQRRAPVSRGVRNDGSDEPKICIGTHDSEQSNARFGDSDEGIRDTEADQAQAVRSGGQRTPHTGRAPVTRGFSRVARGGDRAAGRRTDAVPLQGGYRAPDHESVRRGRRCVSRRTLPESSGPAQGRTPRLNRVVDVQVLEPGRDGTYGGVCRDGFVYNIEVAVTHTYLIGDGVVVHNCHHVSADSYVRALTYFGCIEGMTPFCGFTATLTRMDKRGLGDVIEHVADKRDILWGIRSGHLTDIRPYTTAVDALNLGGVARSSGDFQSSALGSAMVKAHAPAAMARTIAERAPDRQGVSFWPTVATAHLAAHELRTHGRSAAVITGDTSSEERALIFKRVRHGEIQDLVNVMVLTEGFDLPQLSYVAVGKITLNAGLLVQMLGRGLRLSPGKTDCLAFLLEGSSPIPLASLVDLSETTIRQIADGEGLAEAADRQEREDATAEGRVAAVRVTAMDLFARSSSDWMRTERGFWFLPVTNWLVGLIPETELEETYRVVQVWDGKGISQKSRTVWTGMTLEYGMAMGESLAEELDPALTLRSKAASWKRKKSVPVTDAQLSVLRGVPGADRLTKVEASAMISRMFASRKLDRLKVLPS